MGCLQIWTTRNRLDFGPGSRWRFAWLSLPKPRTLFLVDGSDTRILFTYIYRGDIQQHTSPRYPSGRVSGRAQISRYLPKHPGYVRVRRATLLLVVDN